MKELRCSGMGKKVYVGCGVVSAVCVGRARAQQTHGTATVGKGEIRKNKVRWEWAPEYARRVGGVRGSIRTRQVGEWKGTSQQAVARKLLAPAGRIVEGTERNYEQCHRR